MSRGIFPKGNNSLFKKGHFVPKEWRESWSKIHKGKSYPPKNPIAKSRKISLAKKGVPHLNQRGKNCHLWRGGITPLRDKIRTCFKYRQWRSDCFTRDNYTCQFCGKRNIRHHVDHFPKSFSQILQEYKITLLEEALNCDELWNINNGRTLCVDCHKRTDNFFHKGRWETASKTASSTYTKL